MARPDLSAGGMSVPSDWVVCLIDCPLYTIPVVAQTSHAGLMIYLHTL